MKNLFQQTRFILGTPDSRRGPPDTGAEVAFAGSDIRRDKDIGIGQVQAAEFEHKDAVALVRNAPS